MTLHVCIQRGSKSEGGLARNFTNIVRQKGSLEQVLLANPGH